MKDHRIAVEFVEKHNVVDLNMLPPKAKFYDDQEVLPNALGRLTRGELITAGVKFTKPYPRNKDGFPLFVG